MLDDPVREAVFCEAGDDLHPPPYRGQIKSSKAPAWAGIDRTNAYKALTSAFGRRYNQLVRGGGINPELMGRSMRAARKGIFLSAVLSSFPKINPSVLSRAAQGLGHMFLWRT